MSVLSDLHEKIEQQLRDRIALNDFTFLAYPDPSVDANKIEVWPAAGNYTNYWLTGTSVGVMTVAFRIRIEVAHGDAVTAGRRMVDLLAAGSSERASVVDALLADSTLGGSCETVRVLSNEWDVDENWNHVAWVNCEAVLRKTGAQV